MINSNEFIKCINDYFEFLITEFGFKTYEKKIIGNVFYDIQYKDNSRVISISYENIEDYLIITVFILQNGELPNYDDKTKTLHLKKLNELIFLKASKEDINLNTKYFNKYTPKNELDKKLIKEAMELRLCLKYFNEVF